MPIYCGNNKLNSKLVDGSLELGTRYTCLRKGIMKGKNLSYDSDYAGKYEPIVTQKIYCGNKNNLPEEYDRFGSITECLQKGIGLGKSIKAKRKKSRSRKRKKSRSRKRKRKSQKRKYTLRKKSK